VVRSTTIHAGSISGLPVSWKIVSEMHVQELPPSSVRNAAAPPLDGRSTT
jgi:hypothetical protein